MRFAHGHDEIGFINAARQRALSAAYVGDKNCVFHTGLTRDFVHNAFCITQGWNGFWRGEGRDFNLSKTALAQRINDADFIFGLDELSLVLKAIARGDFLHVNSRACDLRHDEYVCGVYVIKD